MSQNYLEAAKGFLTPEEYNREIENVMKAVDLAIEQSKSLEAYAQEQLAALNASVEGLITLDQSVLSVADAIKNLQDVMKNINTRPINITVTGGTGFQTESGDGDLEERVHRLVLKNRMRHGRLPVHMRQRSPTMATAGRQSRRRKPYFDSPRVRAWCRTRRSPTPNPADFASAGTKLCISSIG